MLKIKAECCTAAIFSLRSLMAPKDILLRERILKAHKVDSYGWLVGSTATGTEVGSNGAGSAVDGGASRG